MNQETIDAFMAEYKQLTEKYGITIEGSYTDEYCLYDTKNQMVAEDININEFKATLYVKPAPIQGPRENKPRMSIEDMAAVIKTAFIETTKEQLDETSSIIAMMDGDRNKSTWFPAGTSAIKKQKEE